MNTPELVAEVERLVADRDAHANVIAEVKATAAAALKVEGATTFTLLDLVQELAAQRGNAVRENKMMDTALKAVAQAIGLQAAEPLVSKVEAVVAERDNKGVSSCEGHARNPMANLNELHVERMRTAQGLIIRLSTGLAIGRIYRYGSDLPWTVRYGGVDERTANSLSDALDMFEDLCRGGTPWPHLD